MKRATNFELLKLICMIFVVSLHICTQSGIADMPSSVANGILFIIFSEFGRTACTVFVMVSAWFLSDASFKTERLFTVWFKTLIYTIVIYFFIYNSYQMPWYDFFPIGGGILWFVSAYMCLLLVSPVLNAAIKYTDRNYLLLVVLLIGVPMQIYATISRTDGQLGNNVLWFIWIYLFMGFVKKYPVRVFDNRILMLAIFLITCAIRLLPRIEIRYSGRIPCIESWLPYLDWWQAVLWTIPNFLTAASLFFLFYKLNIKYNAIINFIGAHFLAVYVFHQLPFFYEHLWDGIFQCSKYAGSGIAVLYMIFVIICILVFASLIDLIFDRLILSHLSSMLDKPFKRINCLLNS